ncbi:MAG: hypothetical protein HZT41_18560 [Dechloromonas sp.]|nr:MAG: hypothetical protein HZT41_18560 [Dechloromonas sp.]
MRICYEHGVSGYTGTATGVSNERNAAEHYLVRKHTGDFSLETAVARSDLFAIENLGDNWDTFGSAAPNRTAINNAKFLLEHFCKLAQKSGFRWENPNVSANETGDVVFEWWSGEHKVTIYISPSDAEYLKSWGTDILNEMEDGDLVGDGFLGLWRWLHA